MRIAIISKGNTIVRSLLFSLKDGKLIELKLNTIQEIRNAGNKIVCIYDDIQLNDCKADGKGYLLNGANLISIAMYHPSDICDIHIYDRRVKDEIYILDKSEIMESIKEYIQEGDFV